MASWYEQLDDLIKQSKLSRNQVETRSGVSARTIASWVKGRVGKPQRWQPLAAVLLAIHATQSDANKILRGAGHQSIAQLAARGSDKDRQLLDPWFAKEGAPFMPPSRLVSTPIGRTVSLDAASDLLRRDKLCVFLGMGGIGKTTLAVELAHRLQHDYPDGVFWGDLRIASGDAVLESWGQVCGISMERLNDFKSRCARMRAVFSRKKALIILDDVLDGDLAAEMMPARHSACAVVITTRSNAAAQRLVQRQDHLVLRIPPLARVHSLVLLNEPPEGDGAADVVAELLGDHPLALNICGALCADTGLALPEMVQLLDKARTRLDYLRSDGKPLVRLAFEQSWTRLDELGQKGLTVLAVFEGRPFDLSAFAACMEMNAAEARFLIVRLVNRSLLTVRRQGDLLHVPQYQQHTLLAAFATEQFADDADQDVVWGRFSRYFGAFVERPAWWIDAGDDIWGNVMAGLRAAGRLGDHSLVLSYVTCLAEAWQRRGLYGEARQGYRSALIAANALDDVRAKAQVLLSLGRACLNQSVYEEARPKLQEAHRLWLELGETNYAGDAQYYLARVEQELGQISLAETAVQAAYKLYQIEEYTVGMGRALYRLASIVYARGEHQSSLALALDAIKSQKATQDVIGLLRSYRLVVQSYIQLKLFDEAMEFFAIAESLIDEIDDQGELGSFYYGYADLLRVRGFYTEAERYALKALALFREMGVGSSEVNTLNLLASNEIRWNDAFPERKKFEAGLGYCELGLQRSIDLDYQMGQGYLRLMQGRLLSQKGEVDKACQSWSQALSIAKRLENGWLVERIEQLIDEADC